MSNWTEAVIDAVRRQAAKSTGGTFTREALINEELDRIAVGVGSIGATPHQTLSRELQELRDAGMIEFIDNRGTYRLIK